jgi:hypothetical protein
MMNENAVRDAFVELLTVMKIQLELTATAMAEVGAVRDSVQALDLTFDETFAEKRRVALDKVLPLLAKPIDYIDGLTRRIQAGEIF